MMRLPFKNGVLVPILLLIPNLIFLFLPPVNPPGTSTVPVILSIAENIGRVAVLFIPVFYIFSFKQKPAMPVLSVWGTALVFYYAAWVRYFAGARDFSLLSAPMLGIPLPLAIAPVIFLLASAY